MKKEILELMKKEHGDLRLNEYFKLIKDIDMLKLQCNLIKPNFKSTIIDSNDYEDIKKEIEKVMESDIETASRFMINNFKNGYIK